MLKVPLQGAPKKRTCLSADNIRVQSTRAFRSSAARHNDVTDAAAAFAIETFKHSVKIND